MLPKTTGLIFNLILVFCNKKEKIQFNLGKFCVVAVALIYLFFFNRDCNCRNKRGNTGELAMAGKKSNANLR